MRTNDFPAGQQIGFVFLLQTLVFTDGQRIAYEKHGTEGHIIHTAFVSGPRSARLVAGWSLDRVFTTAKGRMGNRAGPIGRRRQPATVTTDGVLPAGISAPVWSQTRMAYTSADGLHLLNIDSPHARLLTT